MLPSSFFRRGFLFYAEILHQDSIHKHMNNSYQEKQRDLAQ
ncbi:hypothetical protein KIS4809_2215 [Bacillus sp. ZZV12-4809]|nr:hypothetical protein KIS4809_2215 [Bacillus sp. ZZV12-4809]